MKNTFKTESSYGLGKKKTSVARVWICQGTGVIKVNKKPILNYFSQSSLASQIITKPLESIGKRNEFDVRINVKGGGFKSQIDASTSGLANSIVEFSPDYRGSLKLFLKGDNRKVERKKIGFRKARAKRQFSKR